MSARRAIELCPACGRLNFFRPKDVRWHKGCWGRLSKGLDATMTKLKAHQDDYEDDTEILAKAIVALHARVRQIERRLRRPKR